MMASNWSTQNTFRVSGVAYCLLLPLALSLSADLLLSLALPLRCGLTVLLLSLVPPMDLVTASLRMLQILLRDPGGRHLFVVGAAREGVGGEDEEARQLSQAIAGVRQGPAAVHEIALRPLTETDVVRFVADALGWADEETAPALGAWVFEKTAGNPLFIRELLAHLVESGALLPDGEGMSEAGTAAQLQAPEGLRQVIGQRVARLSAPAQRVL